jgi:hypothetical protein
MEAAFWHVFPAVLWLHAPVPPNNQHHYSDLSVERGTPVDVIAQTYLQV